jgi:hypothetical protein
MSYTCPLRDKFPKDEYYNAPEGTPWKEKCPFCWRDANPEAAEQERIEREITWKIERDMENKERRKKGKSECSMC